MRYLFLLFLSTKIAFCIGMTEAEVSALIKPFYSDIGHVKILKYVRNDTGDFYVVKFTTSGVGYGSCASAQTAWVMWIQYDRRKQKVINKFDIVLQDDCKPESTLEIKRQNGMIIIGKRIFVPQFIFDDAHPRRGLQNIEFYD